MDKLSAEELDFILSAPWVDVVTKYGEEAIAALVADLNGDPA